MAAFGLSWMMLKCFIISNKLEKRSNSFHRKIVNKKSRQILGEILKERNPYAMSVPDFVE